MPKLSLSRLLYVFVLLILVLFASTALSCVSLQVLGPSVFVSVLPFLAYLIHLVLPSLLARLWVAPILLFLLEIWFTPLAQPHVFCVFVLQFLSFVLLAWLCVFQSLFVPKRPWELWFLPLQPLLFFCQLHLWELSPSRATWSFMSWFLFVHPSLDVKPILFLPLIFSCSH